MKPLNFLKIPIAFVTFSLALSAFGQEAYEDGTKPALPAAPAAVVEDPRAFEQYLSYMNPSISHNYNIDTTWLVKGDKETEEAVLRRVEGQLRSRLASESNVINFPSWLATEAIVYQRQVVCDMERTDLKGSVIQTIRNTSSDQSAVSSQVSSANSFSNKETVAIAGGMSQSNALAGSQRASDSQSETYKINGNTVIKMEERIFSTTCVKKHYEFRGTLMAERVISFANVDKNLKLYFIRKGLNKIYTDFITRYKTFADVLHYVVNTPNMSQNEVSKMGYPNPSGLIASLKTELSSLVSTYKYFNSTAALFRTYQFLYFSEAISEVGSDMKMKLISIKSLLESFPPTIISIGFINDNQLQSQYFYSQEELALLFTPIGSFTFNSRMKNPADASKEFLKAYENKTTPCQALFNALLSQSQKSLASGNLANFSKAQIDGVKSCTQSVTINKDYYADNNVVAAKYLKGKNCVFSGIGSAGTYGNYDVVFLCQ